MEWASLVWECTDTTCLLIAVLLTAAIYLLAQGAQGNYPPGPYGLPVVGYAPFLGDHGAETLRKLKRKYGPVMSVSLGLDNCVVLNDFDSIYECLMKQGDKFSGRPSNIIFEMTGGRGIILADYGKSWKTLRKFGLTTLRGFGVGKKGMEENIIEELPYLLEELSKNDTRPHTRKLINSVSNIMCRLTFGSRFEYDDRKFSTLIRLFDEYYSSDFDAKLFGIITAAPALRFFPIFRGSFQRSMRSFYIFMDVLKDMMKDHRTSFDKEHIRDFIDAFLVEIHQRGPHDETFNERQLLEYVRDLFEAGNGTTSTTLNWGLLALLNYPECQMRISNEIQEIIGDSGIPSMHHRDQMNYTCAFIQELMRHRTLAPASIMHKTTEEAVVNGYTIPKNTPIIPNIWAVHHDPNLFENPEDFKPERFLDEKGKFIKSKYVIPFSMGQRHCLGVQLARMELFIFLTGIIQKLKVLPDPLRPPPALSSGVYSFLTTYEPLEYRVIFERR